VFGCNFRNSGDSPLRHQLALRGAARDFNQLLAKVAEQRERLKAAAAHDPLTGATNHQQFHESLGIELKRAQRDGGPPRGDRH
jgi:PleD family two-component response regulator